MKILCADVTSLAAAQPAEFSHTALKVFADSAVMKDSRQPLFLPDWAQAWSIWILPAVRICRQGLEIDPHFAARYYDEILTAAMLLPSGCTPDDVPAASLIADTTLRMGTPMPFGVPADENQELRVVSHLATLDDTIVDSRTATTNCTDLNIPATIAAISSVATLKTGDIVLLNHPGIVVKHPDITKNHILTANINNLESLRLKIK